MSKFKYAIAESSWVMLANPDMTITQINYIDVPRKQCTGTILSMRDHPERDGDIISFPFTDIRATFTEEWDEHTAPEHVSEITVPVRSVVGKVFADVGPVLGVIEGP